MDIRTLDYHTGGEPLRIIISGLPELPGDTVLERRNKISRMSSRRDRGRVEQVLMANLDQVVVVQSVSRPDPVDGFVDRLLVAAERFDLFPDISIGDAPVLGGA